MKRVQLYRDANSSQNFRIDCNTGQTVKIDSSGLNIKSYHTNITGVAKPDKRIQIGWASGDEAMMPDVNPHEMLWKTDALRITITKMNLGHFLPRKTPKEKMVRNTNQKELLSTMYSFKTCPQYG